MTLQEALNDIYADFITSEPYAYSGRNMYGRSCLGINLRSTADLFLLGYALSDAYRDVQMPMTDSMGRGIVVYWPNIEFVP
jgi:hypothetical protein